MLVPNLLTQRLPAELDFFCECRHSLDVRLHLGYDRWWQQDKEVFPLSQLSEADVGRLPDSIFSFLSADASQKRIFSQAEVTNTVACLTAAFFHQSAVLQKSRHGLGDGDWWGAELEVPATAAVLDFVLSDGSQVKPYLAHVVCHMVAQ